MLRCAKNNKRKNLKLLVTEERYGAILTLQACCKDLELLKTCEVKALKIIKRQNEESAQEVINKYEDVFQELG